MANHREGNSGIIAETVTGDMIVLGYKASATKTVNTVQGDDLRSALDRLRGALRAVELQPGAREMVDAEVEALGQAALTPAADAGRVESHISSLSDKLKMVGVFVGSVATIAEPLKKIVELLHIPRITF